MEVIKKEFCLHGDCNQIRKRRKEPREINTFNLLITLIKNMSEEKHIKLHIAYAHPPVNFKSSIDYL